MMRAAIILAAGIALAALLHGGIYTMVIAGAGGAGGSHDDPGHTGDLSAYRINRFTGSIVHCSGAGCGEALWIDFTTQQLK